MAEKAPKEMKEATFRLFRCFPSALDDLKQEMAEILSQEKEELARSNNEQYRKGMKDYFKVERKRAINSFVYAFGANYFTGELIKLLPYSPTPNMLAGNWGRLSPELGEQFLRLEKFCREINNFQKDLGNNLVLTFQIREPRIGSIALSLVVARKESSGLLNQGGFITFELGFPIKIRTIQGMPKSKIPKEFFKKTGKSLVTPLIDELIRTANNHFPHVKGKEPVAISSMALVDLRDNPGLLNHILDRYFVIRGEGEASTKIRRWMAYNRIAKWLPKEKRPLIFLPALEQKDLRIKKRFFRRRVRQQRSHIRA